MTKRLKNLLVHEVSLVDKAANNKRFHLTKAADKTPEKTDAPAAVEPSRVEKALAAEVEGEKDGLEPFGDAADVVVAMRRLAKAADVDLKAVFGLKDPEPVTVTVEVEKRAADPLASLAPEARAQVEDLMKQSADLRKALDDEREGKAVAESIAKAAQTYANIPEKAEALGPALRAIRKADAKAADLIENVLKRADALFAQSLAPIGNVATDSGDSTWTKVEKRAAEMVKKGEAKNIAKAIDAIVSAEPALYEAIQAEKKG